MGGVTASGSAAAPAGPVAVVTGGGRGIGRAAALALARAGHPVCVNDTGAALDGRHPDPSPARAVAEEIRAAGGAAMASTADARAADTARALVADVERWAGRAPTVLVHAAGTLRDGMVHKSTDDDWAEVLGSHLGVAVQLTRAMAPAIRSRRYGRIVYVAGAAGLVGNAGQASYCVAKAGLFGLTRALALEMAGRDVRVNYLVPFAFTRMTESIPPVTEQLRAYLEWAPRSTPGDVAGVIAWLCSDAGAAVTGQVVGVRATEVTVWSQPRPAAVVVVGAAGWDPTRLVQDAEPRLAAHLTPLESEFDLFSAGPPAPGEGTH